MANTYFKFKQFKIEQDKAAMKVGTDGVLLGAWANAKNAKKILDIGTGTGLIALMLAQRNPEAQIVAIDIDERACEQANDNFKASPWSDRLFIQHISLANYSKENNDQFDLIISNPPFFKNSLKPTSTSRSIARHNDSLPYTDLFKYSSKLNTKDGKLSLIIPHEFEKDLMIKNKNYHYNLIRGTHVQGDINKPTVRSLLEFGKNYEGSYLLDNLIIEEGRRHVYSDKYKALTCDFYLAF
jgi:tRNA1Val (adenine37-N6)-methyltransferase